MALRAFGASLGLTDREPSFLLALVVELHDEGEER